MTWGNHTEDPRIEATEQRRAEHEERPGTSLVQRRLTDDEIAEIAVTLSAMPVGELRGAVQKLYQECLAARFWEKDYRELADRTAKGTPKWAKQSPDNVLKFPAK